jgi:hypothetical protein
MSNCMPRRILRILSTAASMIVLFLSSSPSRAQSIINVPADQAKIQAAINAASNGDTVLVAPGTYPENINFGGKAITVTSSGGPSVTIIDGGANGSVVTFSTGETTSSVLSGFTIRNGRSDFNTAGFGSGGGIFISDASPTIRGNVISGNQAVEGIGISINGGSPVVQNNTITGNTQCCGTSGGGGGGIHASASFGASNASPLISGNTITNNSLNGGGFGGGILVDYYSTPTIQGNLISGNIAYNSGGGVTLRTNGSMATFVQNVVVNNSSQGGGSGGGVYLQGTSYTIVSNTLAGNTAFDKTSGVFAWVFGPSFVFTNNIVVAAAGQVAITCYNANTTFVPEFSFTDAYSSSGQAWSGVCDSTSLPGNISVDPLFVNAANGDFHLTQGSPAVDVGNNSAPNLPQTDFDGNPRIVDGNNDGISTVDLGAYEFAVIVPPAVSLSPSALVFPPQLVGTSSPTQAVTLTNTGGSNLSIASITSSGPFSQTNNCPPALAAASSCTINVSFTPSAYGSWTGSLVFSDNANTSPQSVGMSGTAVDFAIAPNTNSITIPRGSSGTFSVNLTPLGGTFSNSVGLSCSGLPSGATCRFSPANVVPGSGGASSVVTITTDQPDTPIGTFVVTITGQSGNLSHSTQVQLTVVKKH